MDTEIILNDFISEYTRIKNPNNIVNVNSTIKIISIYYNIDYTTLYDYYTDITLLNKNDFNEINRLFNLYVNENNISDKLDVIQLVKILKVFLEFNHTTKTSTIINKIAKLLKFDNELIDIMNNATIIDSDIYIKCLKYRCEIEELFKKYIDSDEDIEELKKQKRWFEVDRFEGYMMICAYIYYNENILNSNKINTNTKTKNTLIKFEPIHIISYAYNWICDIFHQLYELFKFI